ncbi:hypothetical protein L915_10213 [Phytophthora nicotianae]|uniref:Uncharacterized protein n=1 Tax=Phytophthora nicotianae TaxID=4792 RepID=W2GPR8_PHYNI|nr:hypothetical protein L915_10213 [Phytophthora nicotianae]
MKTFTYATEKDTAQMWRELSKKGQKFYKSRGHSNDGRNLPPGGECKSWLAYGTTPSQAADVSPAASREPEGNLTSSLSTQTSALPPPARKPASKPPAVNQVERAAATPPAASSKGKSRLNKPPSSTHELKESGRRQFQNRAQNDIPAITVLRILPKASRIRLNKLFRMLFKAFRILLIKVFRSALCVPLDDFDPDDFLAALRRDRLFDDGDVGGFNAGGGDWLLALTSDTEGDGDSILQDESDDEVGDDDLVVNVDGESDDGGAVELDKVPVAFELTRGGLDRLQAEEWDVYMEQEAGRVLHDALPLYDRPSDPTRAALAYAEDHLPSVTSSCSRNSGGALEWKRTSIAETALMPLPKQMRFRVLQRRETAPSTSGLSVEEYQTKLARKSAVQPHENALYRAGRLASL